MPRIPLRRLQGFAAEIEALMRRAEAEGRGNLAYLLECALTEARQEVAQQARDGLERDADPRDLWRPEGAGIAAAMDRRPRSPL